MLRAVLIDDEPRARDLLRTLLTAYPHVSIVGEAGDVESGAPLLAAGGYDFVLLDVQLFGGSGFDLAPHVIPSARIIFVTGHDRYAVRAFEVNALDYLLKPVSPDRLAAALARLEPPAPVSALSTPNPQPSAARPPALALDDLVYLKTDIDTARFVRLAEIAAILSSENYTRVHLLDGDRLLVRRTLASWEEALPTPDFLRVHRTAVVNLHAITALAPHDRHVALITVHGTMEPVRARRELLPEIEQRMATLGKV